MSNKKCGKIYILRNPAHKNTIVKIGRTSRVSEIRAKEISSGTGIPSEFEVLYEEDVFDCVLAERTIHKILNIDRLSRKREFFQLPLKRAVQVVFETCLKINNSIKKQASKRMALILDITKASKYSLEKLKWILTNHNGKTPVFICLNTKSLKSIQILVGKDLYVNVSPGLINGCKSIRGLRVEWISQEVNKFGLYTQKAQVLDWE